METTHEAAAQLSYFVLEVKEPGPPFESLVLVVSDRAFERRVVVQATNFKTYWPAVGAAVIYPERTRVDLTPTRKKWLRVQVSNGDDAPLQVQSATAEWRAQEIVFRADKAGEHRLYAGAADVPAPNYDIAAALARSGPVSFGEARFGELAANPVFGKGPQAELPFSEKYRGVLVAGMAVVLLLLAVWTVRLLRSAKPEG